MTLIVVVYSLVYHIGTTNNGQASPPEPSTWAIEKSTLGCWVKLGCPHAGARPTTSWQILPSTESKQFLWMVIVGCSHSKHLETILTVVPLFGYYQLSVVVRFRQVAVTSLSTIVSPHLLWDAKMGYSPGSFVSLAKRWYSMATVLVIFYMEGANFGLPRP